MDSIDSRIEDCRKLIDEGRKLITRQLQNLSDKDLSAFSQAVAQIGFTHDLAQFRVRLQHEGVASLALKALSHSLLLEDLDRMMRQKATESN